MINFSLSIRSAKGREANIFTHILEHILEILTQLHIVLLKNKKQKTNNNDDNDDTTKKTLNLENFKHWDPSLKSPLLQKR